MKKNLIISVLYTVVTTVLLGLVYPLVVVGISQAFFKDKANGQLVTKAGVIVGSRLIGQTFSGAAYFHPRPSASPVTATTLPIPAARTTARPIKSSSIGSKAMWQRCRRRTRASRSRWTW